jgi:hypothetical protein
MTDIERGMHVEAGRRDRGHTVRPWASAVGAGVGEPVERAAVVSDRLRGDDFEAVELRLRPWPPVMLGPPDDGVRSQRTPPPALRQDGVGLAHTGAMPR